MQGGWEVMANYQRRALQRRMRTNRPVLEMMTEFWENHLNVPVNGDAQFTYRAAYGDLVREHALGQVLRPARRRDHPPGDAHLPRPGHVDQARTPTRTSAASCSSATPSAEGNYTEDHVKSSARILTGYTVDMWETWQALYDPEEHWRGAVRVMGFHDKNRKKDGQALTRRYLEYLAHHPATARRIAWKLAVKFVRDHRRPRWSSTLAKVYLQERHRDRPRAAGPGAAPASSQRSGGAKVRDPGEDIVATYRALGIRMDEPRADDSAVNALLWQAGSIGIYPLGVAATRRPADRQRDLVDARAG